MTSEELLASCLALDARLVKEEKANTVALKVPADLLLEVARKLTQEAALKFDMLLSHTAVHWPVESLPSVSPAVPSPAVSSAAVSQPTVSQPTGSVPGETLPTGTTSTGTASAVPAPEAQFELLYCLYSTSQRQRVLLCTRIPVANPVIDSVHTLWRIAEWQEREVYDLFGVLYRGHPDLRRLLLEDDWQGFPLRKDYQDDFMLEGP